MRVDACLCMLLHIQTESFINIQCLNVGLYRVIFVPIHNAGIVYFGKVLIKIIDLISYFSKLVSGKHFKFT